MWCADQKFGNSVEISKKVWAHCAVCCTRVPPPGSQTFLHPLGKNSFFFVNESLIHLIRILLHLLVRARPERYLDSEIKCHKAIPTSWTSIGIFFCMPCFRSAAHKKKLLVSSSERFSSCHSLI